MATTLAPVDSREVVRCDHCLLVQFRTISNLCRRCKTPLDHEPALMTLQPGTANESTDSNTSHLPVALSIRSLRLRAGLSQRQLALRMRVPRTYVSKIENEKACPTLSSLERVAKALHVTVFYLLKGNRRTFQDEIRELQSDEFIAEMIPYLAKLTPIDCAAIISCVRDLTSMPRGSA